MEKVQEGIGVLPINKWKRILLLLLDLVLVWMIGTAIYSLASYKLFYLAFDMKNGYEEYAENLNEKDEVLYGNNLLFFDEEYGEKTHDDYEDNLYYTCQEFTRYYVYKIPIDSCYDIFNQYYVNIKADENSYLNVFSSSGASMYFEVNGSEISLKEAYRDYFGFMFESNSGLTEEGENQYESFYSDFFLDSYKKMILDIEENDLLYGDISYNEKTNEINAFLQKEIGFVLVSDIVSFLLAVLINFLLMPLCNKNRQTLGMILMRVYRINSIDLKPIKKRYLPLTFLHGFLASGISLIFIPIFFINIQLICHILTLKIWASISTLLCLISILYILFGSYSRAVGDRLSKSVLIDKDTFYLIQNSRDD